MTDTTLHVDWRVDSETVELGKAFPLVVTLRWPQSVEVLPFDESAMAPLSITLDRVDTNVVDGEVREIRHYTAYAFALDRVESSPLELRARTATGEVQTGLGLPIALQVESALGQATEPKAEMPAETPALPAPDLRPALIGSVLLLAIVSACVVWRRRFAPGRSPARLSPGEEAHRRLSVLERAGRTHLQRSGAHELAGLVRTYLSRSEQVRDAHAPLRDVIDQIDTVRFAGPSVDAARVAEWIAQVRRLLDAARSKECQTKERVMDPATSVGGANG